MKIIELQERPDLIKKAVHYFWTCWGSPSNFKFYENCILNSLDTKNKLPKFYIALHEDEIIASYALLTNDLISRQDLMPWLGCLHVNEENRKKGIADKLLKHGLEQTKLKGFPALYLSTDLHNFYEKKGWTIFSEAYGVSGDKFKIYSKSTRS
jgi:N-acetylglutamate synthase-like GNAT family acetyltransferase